MPPNELTLGFDELVAFGRSLGHSGNEIETCLTVVERLERGVDSKTLRGFLRRYRLPRPGTRTQPMVRPRARGRTSRRRGGLRSRARSSAKPDPSSDLKRLPGGFAR